MFFSRHRTDEDIRFLWYDEWILKYRCEAMTHPGGRSSGECFPRLTPGAAFPGGSAI